MSDVVTHYGLDMRNSVYACGDLVPGDATTAVDDVTCIACLHILISKSGVAIAQLRKDVEYEHECWNVCREALNEVRTAILPNWPPSSPIHDPALAEVARLKQVEKDSALLRSELEMSKYNFEVEHELSNTRMQHLQDLREAILPGCTTGLGPMDVAMAEAVRLRSLKSAPAEASDGDNLTGLMPLLRGLVMQLPTTNLSKVYEDVREFLVSLGWRPPPSSVIREDRAEELRKLPGEVREDLYAILDQLRAPGGIPVKKLIEFAERQVERANKAEKDLQLFRSSVKLALFNSEWDGPWCKVASDLLSSLEYGEPFIFAPVDRVIHLAMDRKTNIGIVCDTKESQVSVSSSIADCTCFMCLRTALHAAEKVPSIADRVNDLKRYGWTRGRNMALKEIAYHKVPGPKYEGQHAWNHACTQLEDAINNLQPPSDL